MDDTRKKVRRVVGQLASKTMQEVPSDARLIHEVGLHSLQLIELVHILEREFGIEPITEREAMGMVTVKDLEDLVVSRLGSRSST
jgi:acyl carrier protein